MNHAWQSYPRPLQRPAPSGISSNAFGWTVLAGIVLSGLAETPVGLLAVGLIVAAWRWLPNAGGPPVLALAFTHQWAQANAGIVYYALFRRPCPTMALNIDYMSFTWVSNIALGVLLWGLVAGFRHMDSLLNERKRAVRDAQLGAGTLGVLYVLSFGLDAVVQQVAWEISSLTQVIIAFRNLRLFVLFLLFRRLAIDGRWKLFGAILGLEIIYGITGFFANFREPIVLAALATSERFDRRRLSHWALAAALALMAVTLGTLWTNIKGGLRAQFSESRSAQFGNVFDSATSWFQRPWNDTLTDLDRMVDRMWEARYSALAMTRVPAVVPHEGGDLMLNGIKHILMPRIFFPDKKLANINSEAVRKYAGVMVAGAEKNTQFAFGYIIESYVDFGIPGMFVPIAVLGYVMGSAYAWLLRLYRHRDIAVGASVVLFWAALYSRDTNWLATFGRLLVFMVIGATLYLFDRMLSHSEDRAASVRSRLRRMHATASMTR